MKRKFIALAQFMKEQNLTVKDLQQLVEVVKFYDGIPLINNGESLPLSLRYADKTVSETFCLMKKLKGVHIEGLDVDIQDAPIVLPYDAAVKYCQQKGGHLLTYTEALLLQAKLERLNQTLVSVGGTAIFAGDYWLSDTASAPYKAKVFNFNTGLLREITKKCNSFRVRTIF